MITPFSSSCYGSTMLCEYMQDLNGTFLKAGLKELFWPTTHTSSGQYKQITSINRNMIIVILKFKTHEIDLTVLDARTTLSDKIANLGGTFGIWAEVTGLSTLGIINLILLMFKIFLKIGRD